MYAIIEDSGTQLRASVGDELTIDLRDLPKSASSVTFDNVLAVGDGAGKLTIGQPYVKGAKVTADVLEADVKGEKIDVIKFKRRKGYRRKQGHRQRSMKVRVTAINA
ncbi:MAG: 50S ribosomal protein L21 [Phycisphaerales bacterium]|nr:50S ribosomal protein L21 [Phycisphaerales bacterium]